jgi:hypothetical protein
LARERERNIAGKTMRGVRMIKYWRVIVCMADMNIIGKAREKEMRKTSVRRTSFGWERNYCTTLV